MKIPRRVSTTSGAHTPLRSLTGNGFGELLGRTLADDGAGDRHGPATSTLADAPAVGIDDPADRDAPGTVAPAVAVMSAAVHFTPLLSRSGGDLASRGAGAASSDAPATTALRAGDGTTARSAGTKKADARPPTTRREPVRPPEPAQVPDMPTVLPRASAQGLAPAPEPRATSDVTAGSAPQAQAPLPAPPPPGVELAGGLLRSAAHLRVEAGALGAVDLHLRVRDGAVHLRIGGDAAPTLEARSAELSRALASDGLKLGSLEVPHQDGTAPQGGQLENGGGRRDGWQEAADAREAAARTVKTPRPSQGSVVHDGSSIAVQA